MSGLKGNPVTEILAFGKQAIEDFVWNIRTTVGGYFHRGAHELRSAVDATAAADRVAADINHQVGLRFAISAESSRPSLGFEKHGSEPYVHPSLSVTTGFGKDVDAIINLSPSLVHRINDMTREGWVIRYGPENSRGTYTSSLSKEIVIDSRRKENPVRVAHAIAYESGHTIMAFKLLKPWPHETKEEWIDYHVNKALQSEAYAHLTAVQARREILSRGGPDIGIYPKHEEIYDLLASKEISEHEAVRRGSELAENAQFGDNTFDDVLKEGDTNMKNVYRRKCEDLWETLHKDSGTS